MEHVKRGKLKLKTGASLKVASSKDKKKKGKGKSKSKSKEKKESHRYDRDGGDRDDDEQQREEDAEILMNDMTPAQHRHEEHRKKRVRAGNQEYACETFTATALLTLLRSIRQEQAEIEKLAGKTYRERVEELNQYLGSLTEHHDVPRVSAAGNG